MNPNLAEENLQTIRTLMERSTLYRRALAPIMLMAGVMGLAAAGVGFLIHINSGRPFGMFWLATAAIIVTGGFLIARRQALKDSENFWSPPTRRVAQALSLPLSAGLILGILFTFTSANPAIDFTLLLPFLWALLYGCALHSAGAFILRGIRWFGWIYVVFASSALGFVLFVNPNIEVNGNGLMGILFGGLHLAYGIYLYFTEKKTSAA